MFHAPEPMSLRARCLHDAGMMALLALVLVPLYLLLNEYWQSLFRLALLYGVLGLFCSRLGGYVRRVMQRLPAEIAPWQGGPGAAAATPWLETHFGAAEAIRRVRQDPHYVQEVLKPRLQRLLVYRLSGALDVPPEALDDARLAQLDRPHPGGLQQGFHPTGQFRVGPGQGPEGALLNRFELGPRKGAARLSGVGPFGPAVRPAVQPHLQDVPASPDQVVLLDPGPPGGVLPPGRHDRLAPFEPAHQPDLLKQQGLVVEVELEGLQQSWVGAGSLDHRAFLVLRQKSQIPLNRNDDLVPSLLPHLVPRPFPTALSQRGLDDEQGERPGAGHWLRVAPAGPVCNRSGTPLGVHRSGTRADPR